MVRITKKYIIKETIKQGKVTNSEILKPKETKETVSDNKSVKLVKTVSSSSSSTHPSNMSLSDPKNDDVFTDGEADDAAQAQFSANFEFNGVRKSMSNSSLNSINSEDKNNISTSTSINSIANESAKTRKKSETAKENPGAKDKNKSKPKAVKAAKPKESEKPKTSSKSLARPGPASKKQQLLLEPPVETKAEKNKILIKRTRKPRNYLVANRYDKLENSDDENDSIRETSGPDEAKETRSRAKTRKNSSNARQREASSKRAPPARSRSPPKTFSHLRFKVTPKERNEDLISLKKSEAEYMLVVSDSAAKKTLPRLSTQPASKEASFNPVSAKSSIKITSLAEAREAAALAPAELNAFSMECNALEQAWVIILCL